jgi:ectoine hydroxylase-related dioxygenase (phytanoyl-CoA dioxygenase family)
VITTTTFRDPVLETEYREQGFVVTPFLDPDEVEWLRAGYRALIPAGDHGLTIDYMRPDRTLMHEIAALVEPVWSRHFPEVLADHRPVFTTFVTKHPGEASTMFLHEDRTFVDEHRFRAGTLWVPLVDVGPALPNGGLEVIPRSHLLTEAWSGTATPELFRRYETYLRERLLPVAVPGGHALYYDTRTLHASPPNLSSAPREAVVCAVAPREAELIHVVATSRRHRRVHRVDETFFLDVHPHAIDDDLDGRYPVIAEFDDDSRLEFDDLVDRLGPSDTETDTEARAGRRRRPFRARGRRLAGRFRLALTR